MGSLYHHPMIRDRIKAMGVLDRHVRIAYGTCEQVVSLIIGTSPEGLVAAAIGIELVGPDGVTVSSSPVAHYPMTKQDHAMEDARLLATHMGLAVRGCTTTVGWTDVQVAPGDVIKPPSALDFKV